MQLKWDYCYQYFHLAMRYAITYRYGNGALWSKKIYGFGLFLWSLAQTVTGLLSSFTHLIIARVILGIGEAPHLPTGVKVVNDWYNIRERGLPMGIVNMSSTLAQALAPPLLIALMLAFGWRTMFIIIGISGIILSILWFIFYRNREQLELTDDELNYLNDGAPPSSTNKVSFKRMGIII